MRKALISTALAAAAVGFLAAATTNVRAQEDPRYAVLHRFQGGTDPLQVQGLVIDSAGTLYGDSALGGPGGGGARFKLQRNSEFTVLPGPSGGDNPGVGVPGPLLLDAKGNLTFATENGGASGMGGVFSQNAENGDINVLFSFSGSPIDGSLAFINVLRDPAGNLYGVTGFGEQNPNFSCSRAEAIGGLGCGTVYKLDAKTHEETILHNFDFDNGWQPFSLIRDHSGNLYGATVLGGSTGGSLTGCPAGDGFDLQVGGCGVIFRIDAAGNFTIVHKFDHRPRCPFISCPGITNAPGAETHGIHPTYETIDDQGNIFGVTAAGGNFGLGVIYRIDAAGNYSVLHHFAGPIDGFGTTALLLRNGKLYGANSAGGNILDCGFQSGCGTLFMVDTATGQFTVLHTFTDINEGAGPGSLAFDLNGNLLGTTTFGGVGVLNFNICFPGEGCGNIFKFNLNGISN